MTRVNGQMVRGYTYKVPGHTTTIQKTSYGHFIVKDAKGNDLGKRVSRKAAFRLAGWTK